MFLCLQQSSGSCLERPSWSLGYSCHTFTWPKLCHEALQAFTKVPEDILRDRSPISSTFGHLHLPIAVSVEAFLTNKIHVMCPKQESLRLSALRNVLQQGTNRLDLHHLAETFWLTPSTLLTLIPYHSFILNFSFPNLKGHRLERLAQQREENIRTSHFKCRC